MTSFPRLRAADRAPKNRPATSGYLALGGRATAPKKGKLDRSDRSRDAWFAVTRDGRPHAPMPVALTDAERAAGRAWCEALVARWRANDPDPTGQLARARGKKGKQCAR